MPCHFLHPCVHNTFYVLTIYQKMKEGLHRVLTFLSTYLSKKHQNEMVHVWFYFKVCMIFVFSCILEFIVVTAHIRAGKKNRGEMVNFLFLLYLSHLILILIDTKRQRRDPLKKSNQFSHHNVLSQSSIHIAQIWQQLIDSIRVTLILISLWQHFKRVTTTTGHDWWGDF